ncbi:MAG: alginate export family protein [Methylocystis sp.]|nr:alginate export family protein [Methylocystis sp.]MCA3583889.1 alginate export family protein [Methylocystis sp.]MCA3588456.1 alginate export family protein [Methylocystis sp.]MCA3592393.1 alginate export family protein [Methylocystis sp.]
MRNIIFGPLRPVRHKGSLAQRLAARLALPLGVAFAGDLARPSAAMAQIPVGIDEARRIELVDVRIENPSPDSAVNSRLIDRVRAALGFFPGDVFSRTGAELNLARARRGSPIEKSVLVVTPGLTGGVNVMIVVTLGASTAGKEGRGVLISGKSSEFPVLYDKNGAFLRMRLEGLAMTYGNSNAWYGLPGALLAGNPLVRGRTAGPGYSNWAEGYVQAGLYGITPISENLSIYGGISGILSGSAGQELFTSKTRGYFGIEDTFIGAVGGTTTPEGNRLVLNASFGRQRFGVGDGFLIANTASNGGARGALQSNPRWAADRLALLQAAYNTTKIEAFYLDPDELPVIDSRTRIAGINFETSAPGGFQFGGMYLQVLNSDFRYFTTRDVFSREGLQVYDARMRWQPNPGGAGLFAVAEAALQRHGQIAMRAVGWTGELGYAFAGSLPWEPTVSYRYASFSGDNPATRRFERWDPLLSGDNGERWVQGINHFKIFQNSNLSTHRIQLRLRPDPKIELVPQLWFFSADRMTNLGGNPAFSLLQGRYLGSEANLTVKWYISPKVMLQAHVASTFPSAAASRAAGSNLDRWVSTMAFLRFGL